jgi:hypothetical protein
MRALLTSLFLLGCFTFSNGQDLKSFEFKHESGNGDKALVIILIQSKTDNLNTDNLVKQIKSIDGVFDITFEKQENNLIKGKLVTNHRVVPSHLNEPLKKTNFQLSSECLRKGHSK